MPYPRRVAGLLSALPLCLVAGCGLDAAPEEASTDPGGIWPVSPGRRDLDELQSVGGDTVLLPRRMQPRPGLGLGVNGRHVLFLNVEGADVRLGGSNAMENVGIRDRTKNDAGVIELDGYAPTDTNRYKNILMIHKLVAGWYADFNVDVVISRPLSGDYAMTIIGGAKGDLGYRGGIVGISPGDCRNSNEVDLNYAFSASLGHGPFETALTAAHEAGHAFGLGHTRNNRDIMFPTVIPETDGFSKGQVADPGPCGLGPADVQDGPAVLTENLGPREPGAPRPGSGGTPTVRFISPKGLGESGAPVSVGAEITIAVHAEAKNGIDHVTISASRVEGGKARGGHPIAELRPPSSATRMRFSEAGTYQLVAAAYDRASNVALAIGTIQVATPTCTAPNDCSPGQRCINNVCTTPPLPEHNKDELRRWGTACNRSSECAGGICAITPVGQICTHYCNPERFCAVAGLECVDGICLPPMVQRAQPKVGQLGARCTRNQDCFSGECSAASLEDPTAPRYCTRSCEPEEAWSCPAPMSCRMTDGAGGMKYRCVEGVPQAAASGCSFSGASAGGARIPAGGAGAAWLALLLLSLLRHRSGAACGTQVSSGPEPRLRQALLSGRYLAGERPRGTRGIGR